MLKSPPEYEADPSRENGREDRILLIYSTPVAVAMSVAAYIRSDNARELAKLRIASPCVPPTPRGGPVSMLPGLKSSNLYEIVNDQEGPDYTA